MKSPCQEASRLISDSCDRKLTLVEQIQLRFHLLACNFCRDQKHNSHLLEEILDRVQNSDPDLGTKLSDSDRKAIRKALNNIMEYKEKSGSSSDLSS